MNPSIVATRNLAGGIETMEATDEEKSRTKVEPLALADRHEIEDQLKRILAHPLFRLSKRLPVFLEFVVHEALLRNGENALKERSVGVHVFGRNPDYDTGSDPIVRVTATELRKKLAQYYYTDGREEKLRIELPPGSYLPRFLAVRLDNDQEERSAPFLLPEDVSSALATTESILSDAPPAMVVPPCVPTSLEQAKIRRSHSPQAARWLIAVGVVLAVGLSIWGWRVYRRSIADVFWNSFTATSGPILIVMPAIPPEKDITDAVSVHPSVSPTLSIEDTEVASRIAAQLERRDARYLFGSSPEVGYGQMQIGPAILIGALDNVWTMRLSSELPLEFRETGQVGAIVDRSHPEKHWSVDIHTPHTHIQRDFAIIARFVSKTTGQPSIIIAGISSQGTQAAGSMISNAQNLSRLIEAVGTQQNFEAILKTEAIDGRAGPPEIVEVRTW